MHVSPIHAYARPLSTDCPRNARIGSVPNACGCRWRRSWKRASFPLFAHLATRRHLRRARSPPWDESKIPLSPSCSVAASFLRSCSSGSCSSKLGRPRGLYSSGARQIVGTTCFGRRSVLFLGTKGESAIRTLTGSMTPTRI